MPNNRIYTGFRDYYLFIRRKDRLFVIDSKDKYFIEYYVGLDRTFRSFDEALEFLNKIKVKHALERFNR